MNTLDNFQFIDRTAYVVAAEKCNSWAQAGLKNVATALDEMRLGGGTGGTQFWLGCHVVGNMVNPDKGLTGQIWVTSQVETIHGNDEEGYFIITQSGTLYQLLKPFHMRTPGEALDQVMAVAPEELKLYLEESVPFWPPERFFENLSRAVNDLVDPSSTDPVSVNVYAALCNCSEEEMINRFIADGV